jgi:hypothetical protein
MPVFFITAEPRELLIILEAEKDEPWESLSLGEDFLKKLKVV